MNTARSDQIAAARKSVIAVLLPAALMIGAILVVAFASGVHVSELLRDTTDILDAPWYVGLFSTVGITIWAASTAMCILVLSSVGLSSRSRILYAGAVVSLIFTLDDALLIHEVFQGKREVVVFAVYGAIAGWLFWRARHELVKSRNFGVLIVAIALLGLSLAMDFGRQGDLWDGRIPTTIGGVSKYLGAVMWITYFAGVCRNQIRTVAGTDTGEEFAGT